MRHDGRMKHALLSALVLAGAAAHAQGTTCETLRVQIESRIRANGIANPVVSVVEAAASAPGQQVGTCDQGTKKLMYRRLPAPDGARPPPPQRPVITECKDGSVVLDGGECRK